LEMTQASELTGRWGLLPVAVPLACIVVSRIGRLAFAGAPALERVVGGATLALAAFVVGLQALGAMHALQTGPILAALVLVAAALVLVRPRPRLGRLPPWRHAVTVASAGPLLVCGAAMAIVVVAASWLPVWQWDALGYHLPFVNFVLQSASLDGVPRDVGYLSTYPHDVELCFLAFRSMLPDDRVVELAHVPFGVLGAVATAALARRSGARADDAAIAGASWLTLPAVFLQLPTNYIDVACAALLLLAVYWVLATPTPRSVACAGLALGLYLGSKPNAPVPTALLFALLAWRAVRAGQGRWLAVAALSILALGAGSYADNLVRHGNPIWPIKLPMWPLRVGPEVWTLPGTASMRSLLEAGAAAPRAHGPLPWRVLVSWTSLGAPPVFDMRLGGFGLVCLAAVVVAAVRVVRERTWVLAAAALATLASPDPSVARYILAFPALALALAAGWLGRIGRRARAAVLAAVTVGAAWNVAYATPGLSGEGPPLSAYAHMSEAQRVRAVGADGPPTRIVDARERLRPGQAAAYDAAVDLPYLAWTPDLSTRVVRIPDGSAPHDVGPLLRREDVHLLLVGEDQPAGIWARAHPKEALRLFSLTGCKDTGCVAYYRP